MRQKLFLLSLVVVFCSHDMFLKMNTYFVPPQQVTTIQLYNGTFDKSENTISRDRMLDASLIGNSNRFQVNESQWSESDSITLLNFTSGNEGTWVAGVSTKARNIKMKAQAFNDYLKHDGVLDMIKKRTENNTLDQDAVESYSKHVKAIFQVGDKRSNDWKKELGYPLEFIPQQNPYELGTGDTLQLQLKSNGVVLSNQLVYANYKASVSGHTHKATGHSHDKNNDGHSHKTSGNHSHYEGDEHTHTNGQQLRTDDNGMVSLTLTNDGIWYVRTIDLIHSEKEGLTHESNWATLTFEITHNHKDTHTHSHEDSLGIPSYVYWMASIVILLGLFAWFTKTNKR